MYNSLQYLRGMSSILVVYYHIYYTTGAQGVAIFFVISGFIMMDIVHKRERTAWEFFKARFLRIAPLYYILTILTLLLGVAYDPTILRIIQSFTFTALGPVLPVGWTLTYEFIFYTLVSLSIYKWGGQFQRNIFIIISLIIGDTVLNYILISRGYMYGNYFFIFIFGMLSYYVYISKAFYDMYLSKILLYSILFLSILYLFLGKYLGFEYYIDDVNHYIANNMIPSFLIVLSLLLIESNYKLFASKILLLFGNASYSLYLTHYILIHTVHNYYDENFNKWVLLICSLILGVVTYLYVERPLVKYTHKFIKGKNATIK